MSGTPTAETSCFYLNQLLGLLAQWAPYYLHHAIRYESTCLEDVWLSIRKFYGLKQSETQFMKFTDIVWEPNERPEQLYHRVVHHLADNLLKPGCKLVHNGQTVTEAEVMSPTIERLAVLRWMELLHPKLPKLVQKTYDLQRATLKDLQEQISDNIDSLLEEIRNSEELSVNRATYPSSRQEQQAFYRQERNPVRYRPEFQQSSCRQDQPHRRRKYGGRKWTKQAKPTNSSRLCQLCTAHGRPANHPLPRCQFISREDKEDFI